MDDILDVASLVAGLEAENEGTRKYAIFKLQSLLSDAEFADAFIQGDGIGPLRQCVLETTGNAQAYALGGLDALLELDMGWDAIDALVVEKAVNLAVAHPLVNIVRNALTLLVLIVSRPLSDVEPPPFANIGFRAIKPALDEYPHFLESLVQRLNASDHTLCANALQLVNALMRDAIVNGGETEWPKFIKRLQDLGVIGGVGILMRSEAAGDPSSPLVAAILDFQGLTKILLRRWRNVPVNTELGEHKRALKTVHLLSKPEPYHGSPDTPTADGRPRSRKHHPQKWRRLGFETESPAHEFEETGYLGIMDFVEFVRRNEDAYQKILMEQGVQLKEHRCPLARASMSVTLLMFEHFEIDDVTDHEALHAPGQHQEVLLTANLDRLYRPLLLQWARLHTAALNAFMRLWKLSGAEIEDFYKIEELVRIVVERVIGTAGRRTEITKVEEELRNVLLEDARRWQTEGLDEIYEDAWGPHLVQVREQLNHEALQFMKEQRVRCLLKGSWFPTTAVLGGTNPLHETAALWRYVRLSHNRRWLHYQNYTSKRDVDEVPLAELHERIDLNNVTTVDSNVSASDPVMVGATADSTETLTTQAQRSLMPTTKITLLGKAALGEESESALLELLPQSPNLASEWLDGLLLLLDQQPITKTTTSLIDMMSDWGVRLRMLNLRWEDIQWDDLENRAKGLNVQEREVPSREGVDTDYWYAIAEK